MNRDEARRRLADLPRQKLDWILEGTREVRRRWHNQKYFTWVEQQGKTVDELRAQASFWIDEQGKVAELDKALLQRKGKHDRVELGRLIRS